MSFIAIEGIDASGKATQSKLLAKELGAKLFSFPSYETPVGKLILSHLKKEWSTQVEGYLMPSLDEEHQMSDAHVDALMFQCLQFTNRLEKAMEIADTLFMEQDVVADRYLASAIVYGGADGLDIDHLIETQKYLPQPDLNILIDIDPESSVKRRPERRDRYETQPGLMKEVMARYLQLWAKMTEAEPGRWVIVNGEQSIHSVHADIKSLISRQF